MAFSVVHKEGALKIYDGVEKRSTHFEVEGWEPTNTSYEFRFPVDEIFSAKARTLSYSTFLTFVRRGRDYEHFANVGYGETLELPKDEYTIEIDAHCKVYLHVLSAVKISSDNLGYTSLQFDPETELVIGVRSYHRRPEATIHTTRKIEDLAMAVSLLSSSIKVESCERSYPTMRGHPPLIEFADEFTSDLKKNESGIEICIPPRLEYLYTSAPLIYYLFGDVSFGKPSLKTGDFEYPLPRLPRFEAEVNSILRRVFFLDCLVRNAGLYKLELHELAALEGLGFDLSELYSMSIAEQLRIYLTLPYNKIKPYMHRWHLSSYVQPEVDRVRALPFLLDRLSAIYLPRAKAISQKDLALLTVKDLFRGNIFEMARQGSVALPILKDSDSHFWLSSEIPIDVTKAEEDAFYNRLKHNAKRDDIGIALVVNDEQMSKETEMVARIYRGRTDLPIEWTIHSFLTREELKEVFAHGYDMVHYIGHCDEGFQCSDGFLNAKDIPLSTTPIFFLNACKSYEQGLELIKKGSTGGVVTLYYIPNEQALRIGYNFSRLLSMGFPLEEAIRLTKTGTLSGKDYLVVGDGGCSLMQNPKTNVLYLYHVHPLSGDRFMVVEKNYGYSIRGYPVGGYVYSDIDESYYLFRNEVRMELTRQEFIELLEKENDNQPIVYDNKLTFNEEFRNRLEKKIERVCTPSMGRRPHRRLQQRLVR